MKVWDTILDELLDRLIEGRIEFPDSDRYPDPDIPEFQCMTSRSRINTGYFTGTAPEPSGDELEFAHETLCRLCGIHETSDRGRNGWS